MQTRETIERDLAHHTRVRYRSATGREYAKKPGRERRLNAEKSALLFELQVQIRAAHRLIDRIMDAAGVVTTEKRRRLLLRRNWQDRGSVNVSRPMWKPKGAR